MPLRESIDYTQPRRQTLAGLVLQLRTNKQQVTKYTLQPLLSALIFNPKRTYEFL